MYTVEFVECPLGDLLTRVQSLKHEGLRFVQLFAEKPEAGMDLVYTFYDVVNDNALNLVVNGITEESEVPSIQGLYFAAFSYENEAHDLYGVNFVNMQLDFGGHFFNVGIDAPMAIISPEQKAAREKEAKVKAAAAAKAAKAAKEAAAKAAAGDGAAEKPAAKPAALTEEERAKKMEAKLAAMDPEKAAKVRAALAAQAAKKAAQKDGE